MSPLPPGNAVPLMLASDGGVHLTPDSGHTWKLTGSNYGGFTALQIGEMTGRGVGGASPHLDLYYAPRTTISRDRPTAAIPGTARSDLRGLSSAPMPRIRITLTGQ